MKIAETEWKRTPGWLQRLGFKPYRRWAYELHEGADWEYSDISGDSDILMRALSNIKVFLQVNATSMTTRASDDTFDRDWCILVLKSQIKEIDEAIAAAKDYNPDLGCRPRSGVHDQHRRHYMADHDKHRDDRDDSDTDLITWIESQAQAYGHARIVVAAAESGGYKVSVGIDETRPDDGPWWLGETVREALQKAAAATI
jgi:hypothetical protein